MLGENVVGWLRCNVFGINCIGRERGGGGLGLGKGRKKKKGGGGTKNVVDVDVLWGEGRVG